MWNSTARKPTKSKVRAPPNWALIHKQEEERKAKVCTEMFVFGLLYTTLYPFEHSFTLKLVL